MGCKLGNISALNTDRLLVKPSLGGQWLCTLWFSPEVALATPMGHMEMSGAESHYFMTLLSCQLYILLPKRIIHSPSFQPGLLVVSKGKQHYWKACSQLTEGKGPREKAGRTRQLGQRRGRKPYTLNDPSETIALGSWVFTHTTPPEQF